MGQTGSFRGWRGECGSRAAACRVERTTQTSLAMAPRAYWCVQRQGAQNQASADRPGDTTDTAGSANFAGARTWRQG